jgi:hypothetical protein
MDLDWLIKRAEALTQERIPTPADRQSAKYIESSVTLSYFENSWHGCTAELKNFFCKAPETVASLKQIIYKRPAHSDSSDQQLGKHSFGNSRR